MGKLHVILLKCEKEHTFGGTAYCVPDLSQAIKNLREFANQFHKDNKALCPVCKSEELHFHDEETPYDSYKDDGARAYLDSVKERHSRAMNLPNIACASAIRTTVSMYDMNGKEIIIADVSRDLKIEGGDED